MKIVMEWDGDQADLLSEQDGMSLVDNIIWLLEQGCYGDGGIQHNDIHITKEKTCEQDDMYDD